MKKNKYFVVIFLLFVLACRGNSTPFHNEENVKKSEEVPSERVDIQPTDTTFYFDLNSIEQEYVLPENQIVTPEEFLREVSFSGNLGGRSSCENLNWEYRGADKDIPILLLDNEIEEVEWMQSVDSSSCGWKPGEEIMLSVEDPNGEKSIVYTKIADNIGGFTAEYIPKINAIPGKYVLTTLGENYTLTQTIVVHVPEEARVYLLNGKLYLYQFQSEEEVKLIVYKEVPEWISDLPTAQLWDAKNYKMDYRGRLIVELDDSILKTNNYGLLIIGNRSGINGIFNQTNELNRITSTPISSFSMSVFHPTIYEKETSYSIWEKVVFEDLTSPGVKRYNVKIKSTDNILWGMNWCANSQDRLYEILPPLKINFFIDNMKVGNNQFHYELANSSTGWHCAKWSSLLTNWNVNSTHELKIQYSLLTDIYDGKTNYQSGEYEQIIYIDVE